MRDEKTLVHALKRLSALRQSAGRQGQLRPDEWSDYLQAVAELCGATGAGLLQPQEADVYALDQSHGLTKSAVNAWLQSSELQGFLTKVRTRGHGIRMPNPQLPWTDILVALLLPEGAGQILLISLDATEHARVNEVMVRALLVADVLPGSMDDAAMPMLGHDAAPLLPLLELIDELYRARHFQTAALALVNGVVTHCPEIDQAVLGWREGAYVRVRSVSHFERFERKTDTMRFFEAALEEAADQGVVLQLEQVQQPAGDLVTVAHKQLATHLGSRALVTLPLFDASGETVGALMLVSYTKPIDTTLQTSLQFIAQTAITHLKMLREDEAGVVMRVVRRANRALGQVFGPENLWVKASVLILSALLIIAMFVEAPHRVRGSAQFVTDETRLLVAPFNSVVTDVLVTTGDVVSRGQPVMRLDTQELLLQMAELESELQRNQAELDRARAEFTNVDMAIAAARLEQTQARMGQVNYLINQASLIAPFDGIIVEGDRRELLSSPVTRGQVLMRVANPTRLYLLLEIADSNIQYIQVGSVGEFSLVSQPRERIPIIIDQIVPMAVPGSQGGAVFEVKAQLAGDIQSWWRPGMTGVARIDVGKRSLLWVWFHGAWNRVRLFLWF